MSGGRHNDCYTPLSCGNLDKSGGCRMLRGYRIPAPPLCQSPCGSRTLAIPAVEGWGKYFSPPPVAAFISAVLRVVGGCRLSLSVLLSPVVGAPLTEVGVVPEEQAPLGGPSHRAGSFLLRGTSTGSRSPPTRPSATSPTPTGSSH